MDACDPSINVRNLKKLVKQNTGAELNLTREQICDAYASIQADKLPLPPMVLTKDGKYMLDRKSPITARQFEVLFSSSSKLSELRTIAAKVGLASYKDMTKSELVEAIEGKLQKMGVHEPLRLHSRATASNRKSPRSVISINSNNNNYRNNLNVNNVNGNGIPNTPANKARRRVASTGTPKNNNNNNNNCLLYTSPSPRDATLSRMPSSA